MCMYESSRRVGISSGVLVMPGKKSLKSTMEWRVSPILHLLWSAYTVGLAFAQTPPPADSTLPQDVKTLQDLQKVFDLKDTGDPCLPTSWSWIECSQNGSTRVTSVNLATQLAVNNGSIPSTIGDLTELTTLMNRCGLIGGIPAEVSKLTNLIELNLGNNGLTGPLPDLKLLTKLETLKLNDNFLSGPIPDISNLTNLLVLYLFGNRLGGGISFLGTLTHLQDVRLSANVADGRKGLEGPIPDLSSLKDLNTLFLDRNSLSGSVPDLSSLKQLQILGLDDNKLTGPIPDLSALTRLEVLNLGYNSLNGSMPDLSSLSKLQSVSLGLNLLSGPIPDLTEKLVFLAIWDVSNNRLTGPIPESLATNLPFQSLIMNLENNQFTSIPSTLLERQDSKTIKLTFDSSLLNHITPPGPPTTGGLGQTPASLPAASEKKKDNSTVIIIAGVAAGLVGCLVILVVFCLLRRNGRKKSQEEFKSVESGGQIENTARMSELDKLHYGPRKFMYKELTAATKNFSKAEIIGVGGFGSVYKGILSNGGSPVAIKRISNTSRQGAREFMAEVKIIGRMRHRNLVQLLGWCYEQKDLLLVYDYMPNGSLDQHIFLKHESAPVLPWNMRFSILCGVASALVYLHDEWEERVVHRDIKASNVLLDSSFNARLSDFGLARLYDHSDVNPVSTGGAGTLGYVAPECTPKGKVTDKADVYSFGAVALETVCGRKPLKLDAPDGQMLLVEWVWDLCKDDKILVAVDPKLEASTEKYDELQVKAVLQIGLMCSDPNPALRPSMSQVRRMLSSDVPIPPLVKTKPAFYFPSLD
ncbi:hypothetical protein Mapa_002715 [Marchantia paleacea]|nr:hypothetical protein Mapa_002715 [Marchantia paleacea]